MTSRPIRFLHAADLQLDRPCDGLAEIPEHMLGLLIDAPYRAAERVLEVAISERVSFVLLGGDLFGQKAPTARAYSFMQDQFRQYHEHGIEVCWANDQRGAEVPWPDTVPLPPNVHLFPTNRIQTVPIHAGSQTVAEVAGRSGVGIRADEIAEFPSAGEGAFCIAMTSDWTATHPTMSSPIDYWAQAGVSGRSTHSKQTPVIHNPGPIQGRTIDQIGPHGCTVADVEVGSGVPLRFIPCDQLRWQKERLTVSAEQSVDAWKSALAERSEELQKLAPDMPILVSWKLEFVGNYTARTPLSEALDGLTSWLRARFGKGAVPCWTVALEIERQTPDLDEWLQEDTLLGDFLRAVEQSRESDESLLVHGWPTDPATRQLLDSRLNVSRADVRQRVLDQAAELGAALLRGDPII